MSGNLFEQLLALSAAAAENGTAPSYNPHPPGCVVPGSGTDQVHKLLVHVYPACLPRDEIRKRTGLSHGCICWALRFLEHTEKIQVFGRGNKRGNGCYLRYKAVKHD